MGCAESSESTPTTKNRSDNDTTNNKNRRRSSIQLLPGNFYFGLNGANIGEVLLELFGGGTYDFTHDLQRVTMSQFRECVLKTVSLEQRGGAMMLKESRICRQYRKMNSVGAVSSNDRRGDGRGRKNGSGAAAAATTTTRNEKSPQRNPLIPPKASKSPQRKRGNSGSTSASGQAGGATPGLGATAPVSDCAGLPASADQFWQMWGYEFHPATSSVHLVSSHLLTPQGEHDDGDDDGAAAARQRQPNREPIVAADHPLGAASRLARFLSIDEHEVVQILQNAVNALDVILCFVLRTPALLANASELLSGAGSRLPTFKTVMLQALGEFETMDLDDFAEWTQLLTDVEATYMEHAAKKRSSDDDDNREGEEVEEGEGPPPDAEEFQVLTELVNQQMSDFMCRLFSVVRTCVRSLIATVGLLLGGDHVEYSVPHFLCPDDVAETTPLVHSVGVEQVLTLFNSYCAHPTRGMESVVYVEEQIAFLHVLLSLFGLVSFGCASLPFVQWSATLPSFVLPPQAKKVLLYLGCIVQGQQKLVLRPIMRPTVFEKTLGFIDDGEDEAEERGLSLPVSFKLFPSFAQNGAAGMMMSDGTTINSSSSGGGGRGNQGQPQLEQGEGHGPRKELFELIAETLSSPHRAAVPCDDLIEASIQEGTSKLVLRQVSDNCPMALRNLVRAGTRVILTWHDQDERNPVQRPPPSATTAGKVKRKGEVSTPGAVSNANVSSFEATITAVKVPATPQKRMMVTARLSASAPSTFNTTTVSLAEMNDHVVFNMGRNCVWFSPSIQEDEDLHPRQNNNSNNSNNKSNKQSDHEKRRRRLCEAYRLAGWALGTSIVNGSTLPLPLPKVVMKLLLFMLRNKKRAEEKQGTPTPTRRRSSSAAGVRDFSPEEKEHEQQQPESDDDDEDIAAEQEALARLLPQQDTVEILSEADLLDMDEGSSGELDKLREMPRAEYRDFITATLDSPDEITKYLMKGPDAFIADIMVKRRLFDEIKLRLLFMFSGLERSMVTSLPLFARLTDADLQAMTCGKFDDGKSSFAFGDSFRMTLDPEFARYRHRFVFKKIVLDVLDGRFVAGGEQGAAAAAAAGNNNRNTVASTAEFQRDVLRFITGARRLPAGSASHPSETITLELLCVGGDSCSSFDNLASRLPTSHTCSNTLEIPNYLESLLFCSRRCDPLNHDNKLPSFDPKGSSQKRKKNDKSSSMPPPPGRCTRRLSEDERSLAWSALSEGERSALKSEATQMLIERLLFASTNTTSYELDGLDEAEERPAVEGVIPSLVHEDEPITPLASSSSPSHSTVSPGESAFSGRHRSSLVIDEGDAEFEAPVEIEQAATAVASLDPQGPEMTLPRRTSSRRFNRKGSARATPVTMMMSPKAAMGQGGDGDGTANNNSPRLSVSGDIPHLITPVAKDVDSNSGDDDSDDSSSTSSSPSSTTSEEADDDDDENDGRSHRMPSPKTERASPSMTALKNSGRTDDFDSEDY